MPFESSDTVHETTLFANINGKYERIGTMEIETNLTIEPDSEMFLGDLNIDIARHGTEAVIEFKPVSPREYFKAILPFLASNNWRKLHGLPMWRR